MAQGPLSIRFSLSLRQAFMGSWEQMEPKKTTLLNLISHFTRPDEGQILLGDQVQSTDFYQYIGISVFCPSTLAITKILLA